MFCLSVRLTKNSFKQCKGKTPLPCHYTHVCRAYFKITKQRSLMTVNRKLITYTISLFIPIIFSTKLFAQGNLMKQVTIGELKQQTLASVLNKIANKEDFYFAYNNKIIPADSLVSISGYRGTLFNFLGRLLGEI